MRYSYFVLTILLFLGIGSCWYFGSTIYREIKHTQKAKNIQLQKSLDNGVEMVTQKAKAAYAAVEVIHRLTIEHKTIAELETLLQDVLAKNSVIISCSIAYAPYMYDPQHKLMSRRVVRTEKEMVTYALETKDDYTLSEWYRHAQSGNPYWSAPFLDEVSKQLIMQYSYPFYITDPVTQKQTLGGVINASLPLGALDALIIEISLDKSTIAMLVHANGALLAHPTEIVTHEEKSILKLARTPGNKELLQIYNQLKNADEGSLMVTAGTQGNLFHTVYRKVPHTDWYLILMRLENENILSSHTIFRLFVLLLLSIVLLLTSTFGLFFFYCCPLLRAAWFTTSLFSFLLAASIGTIWALDLISDIPDITHENIVETDYAVQHFFFLERKNNPHIYKKEPIFIPTGLYITSLEPSHDGSLTINGHVWQKYDRAKYPDLEAHVLFLNATEQETKKESTTFKEKIETIGWWFKATFPAQFNFLKYPFDEQEIVITLGHKDFETNIILTPDFEAYLSSDSPKSEIDPGVFSNQWIIKQTYSFYELTNFQTDFGIEDYGGQKGYPQLNFGISIRRQFVYPLTASALPVIIILFVVFSIVLLTGFAANRTSLGTEIIKLTSSIFFATAIAHQTFQRYLQSPVITYFEYFYFLCYGIILLTAINGLLFAYNRGGIVMNWHNNLIPRLMYWPITLLLSMGLTLWFFYI